MLTERDREISKGYYKECECVIEKDREIVLRECGL